MLRKQHCSVLSNPGVADLDCISNGKPQHTISHIIFVSLDVLVVINEIKESSAVGLDGIRACPLNLYRH